MIWEQDGYHHTPRGMFDIDFWRPHRLLIDALRQQLYDQLVGQYREAALLDAAINFRAHDLCWLSCGALAHWTGGLLIPQTASLFNIVDHIRRQCDLWWPMDGVVIACQRPIYVEWDYAHRLHCADGPAVKHADGFELFMWHGCNVPGHWIMDRNNLDPADVLEHANSDVRAAGASLVGWDAISDLVKCEVLDVNSRVDIGQLVELTLPGTSEPIRYIKAECPYDGRIFEVVPRVSDIGKRPVDTAFAAQAWRSNCAQAEYHPL